MSEEKLSIDGGWLGTYYYRGAESWQSPVRFEATFAGGKAAGSFTGTILDDDAAGEADVTGEQTGREVRFTKVYRRPPPYVETGPIEYRGVFSEDGKVMTGSWELRLRRRSGRARIMRGKWEAHRRWSFEEEPAWEREDSGRELVTSR